MIFMLSINVTDIVLEWGEALLNIYWMPIKYSLSLDYKCQLNIYWAGVLELQFTEETSYLQTTLKRVWFYIFEIF